MNEGLNVRIIVSRHIVRCSETRRDEYFTTVYKFAEGQSMAPPAQNSLTPNGI